MSDLEQDLNDQLNSQGHHVADGTEPPVEETIVEDEPPIVEDDDDLVEPPQDDHVDDDEPPKPVSRAQQRIQALANEKKAVEAQAELARQQADFYRRQAEDAQRQLQTHQRPADEFLDPDERARRQEEEWRQGVNRTLQQVQFNSQDQLDKSTFLSKYGTNQAFSGYADRVEAELAKARGNGSNPPREVILQFIIGQDAIQKMSKVPVLKREAKQRVDAARGQPLGTKSNVAPSKASAPNLYERLKDIPL